MFLGELIAIGFAIVFALTIAFICIVCCFGGATGFKKGDWKHVEDKI